jgi:hypothetical protein
VSALALAAIGRYGVLSYGAARRNGEIAIRLALGALPGRVISMILRETIGLVGVGLALGGGLADVASRLIDSRLYGVAPQDPLTLALATGLLSLVALKRGRTCPRPAPRDWTRSRRCVNPDRGRTRASRPAWASTRRTEPDPARGRARVSGVCESRGRQSRVHVPQKLNSRASRIRRPCSTFCG